MCNPASLIVTEDRAYWSRYSDGHERIIQEHNLADGDYLHPSLVRVEISPPDQDFSIPLDQWRFRVDQDIFPDWYNVHMVEQRARSALASWARQKLHVGTARDRLFEGQHYVVNVTNCKAHDRAAIIAFGTSEIDADGYATVNAQDKSLVEAYEWANIFAAGHSHVTTFGSCTCTLNDYTHCEASTYSIVRAYDKATVHAEQLAAVWAYGASTVYAKEGATVFAFENCLVHAAECSRVIVPGGALVRQSGPDTYKIETIPSYGPKEVATIVLTDSAKLLYG